MTGPQQQHDDPFGETRAQLVQALAVAATVGEAAARWAAVGVQNRASQREQADRAEQVSVAARAQAEKLAHEADLEQDRVERQHVARAFDDDWLNRADLAETARLWRTATLRSAGGDRWARQAMGRAEERLRQLRPNLMDLYDRFRGEGRTPAEAMRAAAYGVWLHADDTTLGPQARPHPGHQPAGLRAGAHGRAVGPAGTMLDDLDAAVRREVADLAAGVDPEALDRLQRQWRSAGLAPAADAAELLARYARQLRADGQVPALVADRLDAAARRAAAGEAADATHLVGYAAQHRGRATRAAGTPDLTATVSDEHRDGLVHSSVSHGDADHDALRAGQQYRMARTFPHLSVVQATQAHLAGKQPVHTVPTRQIGRAR